MKRCFKLLVLVLLTVSLNACTFIKHCPTYEAHYSSYKGKHHLIKKNSLTRHHRVMAKSR